jgi:hypothetical protein
MRVKVVLQKVYVAFVLLVLLTIQVSMPVVNANDEVDGSVTSYGFNNPTILSDILITETSGVAITSGVEANSLTRTSEFVIQFDVFDLDGFQHLDVYVALFNTDGSSAESDSGVLITAINSGVEDRGLVLRWLAPERSTYLSGLSETYSFDITSGQDNFLVKSGISPINSGTYNSGIEDFVTPTVFNANSGVTWVVNTSASALATESGVVNTLDASGVVESSEDRNIKYRVTIPFTMSKVATSSGAWTVGVMIHDRLQQEISGSKTDILEDHYEFSAAYGNQWYGEVQIEGNDQITFTDVLAGSGFQIADQSGVTSGIQVRFISNGIYNQQVQSDTTWLPSVTITGRPVFAYLTTDSGLNDVNDSVLTSSGNRFALQARRIEIGEVPGILEFVNILPKAPAENDPINLFNSNSAVYRQPGGDASLPSRIGAIADAPGTTEVGVMSIFEFQIRLSSVFQNTTYSGNVTIGISNQESNFFSTDGSYTE